MKIKKQTIASTHTDLHGERLSKAQLFHLFDSFPKEMVLNDNHDLSRPPIARAKNLTFGQMDDGEWAIFADIEIDDEGAYRDKNGVSISWLGDTLTLNPGCTPDIEIYFNPRYFTEQEARGWVGCTNEQTTINTRELKQKGLESALILIVKFVSVSALAGFFGKAGADAYDALKSKLFTTYQEKDGEGKSVALHLSVPRHLSGFGTEILLELPAKMVPYLRSGGLDFEDAAVCAKKLPFASSLKKVVMHAEGTPPRWRVRFYVKSDDTVITI